MRTISLSLVTLVVLCFALTVPAQATPLPADVDSDAAFFTYLSKMDPEAGGDDQETSCSATSDPCSYTGNPVSCTGSTMCSSYATYVVCDGNSTYCPFDEIICWLDGFCNPACSRDPDCNTFCVPNTLCCDSSECPPGGTCVSGRCYC
ncbi:MAG: hypothetical protein AAGD01_11605 [Acidobacteriota bacterium]